MEEWRASSSSSRYIYRSYKRGKRSAHLRESGRVQHRIQNVGYDRLLMRALPGVAQLRGLLRRYVWRRWKGCFSKTGRKMLGWGKGKGKEPFLVVSFSFSLSLSSKIVPLSRDFYPKKQKRETGDVGWITGMMDDRAGSVVQKAQPFHLQRVAVVFTTIEQSCDTRYLDTNLYTEKMLLHSKKKLVSFFVVSFVTF